MGKKINNTSKGKKEVKELQPVTRKITINLHKQLHGEKFKKKAPKAVKVVKALAQKMMSESTLSLTKSSGRTE